MRIRTKIILQSENHIASCKFHFFPSLFVIMLCQQSAHGELNGIKSRRRTKIIIMANRTRVKTDYLQNENSTAKNAVGFIITV